MKKAKTYITISADSFVPSIPSNSIPISDLKMVLDELPIVKIQKELRILDERIEYDRTKCN